MKTFATKGKCSSPKVRNRPRPSRFGYRSPEVKAEQAQIGQILHSTGAQAKLTIGQPNDKYEQEADRVADQVMRMSDADVAQRVESGTVQPMRIQRMCPECEEELQRQPDEEEEDRMIQAKEIPGRTPQVISSIESRINSLKSGGQPLDPATRAFFEPRFGHDFGHVRVHEDEQAADISRSINAQAFTLGNHVVFGSGQNQPQSTAGKRLLGHELTHVLQQRKGGVTGQVQRTGAGGCARPTETVDERREELSFAGRIAHKQIQGYFSLLLNNEVPVPRATKNPATRGMPCPPGITPPGQVDLWKYRSGIVPRAKVGEIKSVNGAAYAAPDAAHYINRIHEVRLRFTDTPPCEGPQDRADETFDRNWLYGDLARGRPVVAEPLDEVIPESPPTRLGPFWGDPLRKTLSCERRVGGAIVYWCNNREDDDDRRRERQSVRVPVTEEESETGRRPERRTPRMIQVHPLFHEPLREVAWESLPSGRNYVVITPNRMFEEVNDVWEMERVTRHMRIDVREHPIHAFRIVTWGTLAVVLAVGTVAAITVAVGAALTVPVSAAVGTGVAGTGAAAGGATVIAFPAAATTAGAATAVEGFSKAAAIFLIVTALSAGASEAEAADHVERALSDPEATGLLDVTDDPFFSSGGTQSGSRVTIDGRPYRVIATLAT